jgi:hypothetical protein
MELFIPSIAEIDSKLGELGLTFVDGKVLFIVPEVTVTLEGHRDV